MNIKVLIPARGGSKGIPKKNLYLLNGKPLLYYVIQVAVDAFVTDVYVSTDDEEIATFAKSYGANTIDRPKEIAGDTSPIEETIKHFTDNVHYDILVLLSPTSPLTKTEWINEGIIKILKGDSDSVFSGVSMEKNDILFWNKENMKPVNYNLENRGRRQDRVDKYIIETGSFYITTKEQFLSSGNRLGGKIGYVEIPFWSSFEVDELEDLKNIERLMKDNG